MLERSAEFVSSVSNFSEEEFRYALSHAAALSDKDASVRVAPLDLILLRFLSRGQMCLETRSLGARILLAAPTGESPRIAELVLLHHVCECELDSLPEFPLIFDQTVDLFEMSRIVGLLSARDICISGEALRKCRITFATSMHGADYHTAAMAAICLATVDREYLPIYKAAERQLSFIEREMRQTAIGMELYLLRRQLCS